MRISCVLSSLSDVDFLALPKNVEAIYFWFACKASPDGFAIADSRLGFAMHRNDHSRFRHSHNFVHDFDRAERRTRIVIAITGFMMVLEITVGLMSHSMALLADGWHMSTHVIAFVIAAMAYHFTRRHATDARFSFGTGKIGVLGGYSSAIVLSLIALAMAGESVHRLFSPLSIHFNEAIAIAALGLCVNWSARSCSKTIRIITTLMATITITAAVIAMVTT
jgi:predicted Co/Zn/Cd cation transporter (cation efflux family)